MDAAYRSDLRELNELNFARFDAKLEQRLAEFQSAIQHQLADFQAKSLADSATRELRMERRYGEHARWLLGMWATIILAAAALWFKH